MVHKNANPPLKGAGGCPFEGGRGRGYKRDRNSTTLISNLILLLLIILHSRTCLRTTRCQCTEYLSIRTKAISLDSRENPAFAGMAGKNEKRLYKLIGKT
jgi:hypothetical protein